MAKSPLRVSLPPDPNTCAPNWTLPAGACDTHTHVFGPPDLFPYSESRRYTPPAAPIEHYINVQEITGLSRVVFCTPTAHGNDNRVILDAIAKLGMDRAKGIANIDASFDDAALDALHAGGMRGARFHLMDDRPGSKEFINTQIPRLLKRNWILDLHIDPKDFLNNEAYIRALPTVTIIDHMARVRGSDGIESPAFQLLLDLLKEERFWVKICSLNKVSKLSKSASKNGLPYMDMVPMAQAVIKAAPDRVLFGTDWPHGNVFTPGGVPNVGDLLDLFALMAPDEAMRRRILVDNPARLFGFQPA
jgi:predicted TIM-barrel fold metal-dependent hydrolase